MTQRRLAEAAAGTRAWACYDCGKCTATCPLVREGARLSPRRQVLETVAERPAELAADPGLMACRTCGLCDQRCPAQVQYSELVLRLRALTQAERAEGECPHGGALQSTMRLMARAGAKQRRLEWLDSALSWQPERGSVFLWTGCTVYYDALFPELGLCTVAGTRAALQLLNRLGEVPVVSAQERCCGHDLLVAGEREPFEALAGHNIELLRASGAETVVVPCGECLRTLTRDYAPYWEQAGVRSPRVVHLSQLCAERAEDLERLLGEGSGAPSERSVTFQDPCRLGRHLGIVAAPRDLLDRVPGVRRLEMSRSGLQAECCGGGGWSRCDRYTKAAQVRRLREARATGARTLVTSCPKCQVHLRCALQDPALGDELRIDMLDLAEVVVQALP